MAGITRMDVYEETEVKTEHLSEVIRLDMTEVPDGVMTSEESEVTSLEGVEWVGGAHTRTG